MWENEEFTLESALLTKERFRQINSLTISSVKPLLSKIVQFFHIVSVYCEFIFFFPSITGRPLYTRLGAYLLVGIYMFLACNISKGFGREFVNTMCDSIVCNLGTNYCEGGIEYYDKISKRIELIRKLHPKGKDYFSENGNALYLRNLETKDSLPSKRLKECRAILSLVQDGKKQEYDPIGYFLFSIDNDCL